MSVGFLVFILNTALGLFTLYKTRTKASIFFSLFAIGFGFWALCIHETLVTSMLIWARLAFTSAICGVLFLFLFSLHFPRDGKIRTQAQILAIVPLLIFFCISFTDYLVKTVSVTENGIVGTFGFAMSIYKIAIPIYTLFSLIILIRSYILEKAFQKQQVGYVLLGFILFSVPTLITNVILPLWFNIRILNGSGPLFSLFLVACISYAIVRHQFLDIKIIIQKGIIYSSLLVVIVTTYVGSVTLLNYIFGGFSQDHFLASLVTIVIGIFGVPPLKTLFQKVTDSIFFKYEYSYVDTLEKLTEILNTSISVDVLIARSTDVLIAALKSKEVHFHLSEAPIVSHVDAISIPVKSNTKQVAVIDFYPKKSGDSYTEKDIQLMNTFAKQAAVALDKAKLYTEVKEYAETLESRVQERTEAITRMHKEKEMLMLEISHGLQTPLTIMKGELFFLRKHAEMEKIIETLDTSIDRISLFITKLLALSRVESVIDTQKKMINLTEICEATASFFDVSFKQKEIIFVSSFENNVYMKGNKELLEELFSNLLSNAIKYIGNNVKRITFSLSTNNQNIVITISDTGIGMTEDEMKDLCKVFYRVKNSDTKDINGTGLGLVICKKIIDSHAGHLDIVSEKYKGTTFTITFPYNSNNL